MNLTIPQLCKSVQRLWRYEVIKNITYIQDTREKHNPSLAVRKKQIYEADRKKCSDRPKLSVKCSRYVMFNAGAQRRAQYLNEEIKINKIFLPNKENSSLDLHKK